MQTVWNRFHWFITKLGGSIYRKAHKVRKEENFSHLIALLSKNRKFTRLNIAAGVVPSVKFHDFASFNGHSIAANYFHVLYENVLVQNTNNNNKKFNDLTLDECWMHFESVWYLWRSGEVAMLHIKMLQMNFNHVIVICHIANYRLISCAHRSFIVTKNYCVRFTWRYEVCHASNTNFFH